jgi:DNA-binding transcriptional ArsR family regulator
LIALRSSPDFGYSAAEISVRLDCFIKQCCLIFFYARKLLMSSTNHRVSTDGRLDAVFNALAHSTRRALLARLAKRPAMITELAEPFAMSLPAVSRHIRVLEGAGLVTRSVDGRMHRCSLNPKPFKTIDGWLLHYRQFWEDNLAALARYVESGQDL